MAERKDYKANLMLDLRGIECPLNFVKTKLQLDKMKKGEVLEVLLDDGEAIESVPPSIIEEGHTIVLKENYKNYYKITILRN